VLSSFKNLL